jgi:hypothetical protein
LQPLLPKSIGEKARRILVCAHVVGITDSHDLATPFRFCVRLDNTQSVSTETSEQMAHHVSLRHNALNDA